MLMKCKYEVKSIFPNSLSYEDLKKELCKKIARIIIVNEKNIK